MGMNTPQTPFKFEHYGKQEEMAPFPKEFDPDSSEFKAKNFDKDVLRMLVKKCKKTGKRPSPNDYYQAVEVSAITEQIKKTLRAYRKNMD